MDPPRPWPPPPPPPAPTRVAGPGIIFGDSPASRRRRAQAEEPDEFLLEAMREVDALTPACPPIAPQPSPTYRRDEWLASLRVPDAPAAEAPPPLPEPDRNIFETYLKW